MGTVTIREKDLNPNLNQSPSLCSGNMFCIIPCRQCLESESESESESGSGNKS